MNRNFRRRVSAVLLATSLLTVCVSVRAQHSVGAARPSITVLDSTKEQDGLVGSVRRVKTETAKIELKDGRAIEGPAQLVEVTTYGIKGNRIDNTSYPLGGSLVGKEEYKYDPRGNITEMTLRDDRGAIISREAYTYEFDKFGNWTRMVTNLVVFENGELKKEPVEVTYRTLTYYFDDSVAKAAEEPVPEPIRVAPAPEPIRVSPVPEPIRASPVPEPATTEVRAETLEVEMKSPASSVLVGEPPAVPNPIITNQKRAIDFYQAGHAYLKLEKNGEAVKAFQQCVNLYPDDAEAQYALGLANFRAGRFRAAAESFKKATKLSPQMAKAHYGLGLAYQELGNEQGLTEEYRILERLDLSLARKLSQSFPAFKLPCRRGIGCP